MSDEFCAMSDESCTAFFALHGMVFQHRNPRFQEVFFAKRAEKQMHIAKTSAVQTVHRPPLLHY